MPCDWLKGKTPFKRRFSFKRRLKRHKTIRIENDTKTPFWTKLSALPLYIRFTFSLPWTTLFLLPFHWHRHLYSFYFFHVIGNYIRFTFSLTSTTIFVLPFQWHRQINSLHIFNDIDNYIRFAFSVILTIIYSLCLFTNIDDYIRFTISMTSTTIVVLPFFQWQRRL